MIRASNAAFPFRSTFKGVSRLALAALCGCGLLLGAGAAHAATVITLSTGETLIVDVIEANDATVRFVHPVLGDMTLARDKVTNMAEYVPPSPAPGASATQVTGETAAAVQATQAKPSDAPAATTEAAPPVPPEPDVKWTTKIVAGGSLTFGNTENKGVNATLTTTRESTRMKTVFDLGYFYQDNNDVETENRFTAGLVNDWLFPGSKWLAFAKARYDHDKFQSWDDRVGIYGGFGYRFFDQDPFKLTGRLGAGAIREWGSDNDEWRPEGLVGLEGSWKISEKQSLVFDTTYYPDLEEFTEFRWVSNAGWSILLDEKMNLSLTTGLQHEYQSEVDEGRDNNDFRVYAGLQLEF